MLARLLAECCGSRSVRAAQRVGGGLIAHVIIDVLGGIYSRAGMFRNKPFERRADEVGGSDEVL